MANTKITTLYPVIKESELVLETQSGVYYVWRNETTQKYDHKDRLKNYPKLDWKQYKEQVILKDIKHPVLLRQGKGYWSSNTLFVKNFGNYIGVYQRWLPNLRVKDFIANKNNNKIQILNTYNWRSSHEYRFYKDRSVLMVNMHVFNDGTVIYFIENPKYKGPKDYRNPFSIENSTNDYSTRIINSVFNLRDTEGNSRFLNINEMTEEEIAKFRFHISASNTHGITPSYFYSVDIAKGYTTPVTIDNRDDLRFADSTIDMLNSFYNDVEKDVWDNYKLKYHRTNIHTMEDLLNFVSCPTAEKSKKILEKKQSNTEFALTMFEKYGVSCLCNQTIITRSGDDIIATIHKKNNYSENKALLIHNIKKHTNKLFNQDNYGIITAQIPSFDNIMHYFNIVPVYNYGAQTYSEPPKPVFLPSFDEVFADTNVMLFKSFKDKLPNLNCFILKEHSIYEKVVSHYKWNLQDIVSSEVFSSFGWAILFSDKNVAYEQMLKSDLFYLFVACLEEQEEIKDFDKSKDSRHYYSGIRMGIHSKAKNLKKFFDLNMNQIKLVDALIKSRYEKISKDNGRGSYGYYCNSGTPVIPAIYKMDEVLNTTVKNIDINTFNNLITNLVDKKLGSYTYFNWDKFQTSYEGFKELISLSPSQYIDWLSRGYNFEQYSDYLRMRAKLKQIAEVDNRPDLFNESAFPVYVKEPEDVKRLHDIAEKITFAYQNKEKSRRFDAAVITAKKFEFVDKDSEEEQMCIIAPDSITDLVEEGTELHHCVKSPMWIDAIANCESTILFIRKVKQKQTPYFTIELSPTGKIRQCHGLSNCDPNLSVIEFLKRWAKAKKEYVDYASITSHYSALCAPR